MNRDMYNPDALASRSVERATSINRVYNFVYGWMTVALVVSGVVAWMVAQAVMTGTLVLSSGLLMVCCLAEVALVFFFSAMVQKLQPAIAALIFLAYSALNGVTLSVFLLVYTAATIQMAFFVTAGTFAAMALFGTLTRKNLSGIGRICFMGLVGILIASLVNLFMGSSGLDYAICLIGVGVFVGLTAYDAQNVRRLAEQEGMLDGATINKLGLLCALSLYLDFVNLFIMLARLLGDRR